MLLIPGAKMHSNTTMPIVHNQRAITDAHVPRCVDMTHSVLTSLFTSCSTSGFHPSTKQFPTIPKTTQFTMVSVRDETSEPKLIETIGGGTQQLGGSHARRAYHRKFDHLAPHAFDGKTGGQTNSLPSSAPLQWSRENPNSAQ